MAETPSRSTPARICSLSVRIGEDKGPAILGSYKCCLGGLAKLNYIHRSLCPDHTLLDDHGSLFQSTVDVPVTCGMVKLPLFQACCVLKKKFFSWTAIQPIRPVVGTFDCICPCVTSFFGGLGRFSCKGDVLGCSLRCL